jgi:hypothetical protein
MRNLVLVAVFAELASAFVLGPARFQPLGARIARVAQVQRSSPPALATLQCIVGDFDRAPSRREALAALAGVLMLPTAAFAEEGYTPAPLNGRSRTVVLTVCTPLAQTLPGSGTAPRLAPTQRAPMQQDGHTMIPA